MPQAELGVSAARSCAHFALKWDEQTPFESYAESGKNVQQIIAELTPVLRAAGGTISGLGMPTGSLTIWTTFVKYPAQATPITSSLSRVRKTACKV
jgi:hypothetical protein